MSARSLVTTRRLVELVGDAHGFELLEDFRAGILELLRRAVPSDYVSYNEVGEEPDAVYGASDPPLDDEQLRRWVRVAHENPLLLELRRTGDGRPKRFSDVIERAALERLAIYRDFYRPLGIESQVAFTLPARPPLVIALALSRGPDDYDADELLLLTLARPHLIQAYRSAELTSAREATLRALEDGFETLGRQVVVLDPRGRVEFATPDARRLLGARSGRRSLDPAIYAWVEAQRGGGRVAGAHGAGGSGADAHSGAEPLVLRTAEATVLVRLLPSRRSDRRDVLLIERDSGELTTGALRTLGLTARQAEALRLLALGRTPADAARELGIAPRTLDKHLQHVYAKLGVSSRYEATATAWAAVGVGAVPAVDAIGAADARRG
ncbi:response regulator transcription factor [Conexibacter sp. CPCC 206217]|uniref:response regulator transcription factor n=1 Tax=Conexibacter sp. CPCC 206217 TaxID=3064574 RepID=UPI00271B98E0|nr:helix-turn-helix transcriptional regulator [Conexibacter sp. CPCC 206217]MDO8211142.1 helix-turn-helix transcriptional regulator [Conexibacter sp. CPCC 206217]